jgi:hypothetical protein
LVAFPVQSGLEVERELPLRRPFGFSVQSGADALAVMLLPTDEDGDACFR